MKHSKNIWHHLKSSKTHLLYIYIQYKLIQNPSKSHWTSAVKNLSQAFSEALTKRSGRNLAVELLTCLPWKNPMAKSIDLMEATGSWEHQSDLNDLLIVRKMEHPLLGQLISSEYDEYVWFWGWFLKQIQVMKKGRRLGSTESLMISYDFMMFDHIQYLMILADILILLLIADAGWYLIIFDYLGRCDGLSRWLMMGMMVVVLIIMVSYYDHETSCLFMSSVILFCMYSRGNVKMLKLM